MPLSLCTVLTLACTFRTDLPASGQTGSDGGVQTGGATTTGGQGGAGGSTPTGGSLATGGNTATGGSGPPSNDGSCTSDDDCLQCIYALAPSNPDECEHGLGCCGGPVMNQTACATNQVAWEANCQNRGYTPPICPCIVPSSDTPTCRNGRCGYW